MKLEKKCVIVKRAKPFEPAITTVYLTTNTGGQALTSN